MKLRLATEADLPQLVAISEAAGAAAHWSRQQWLDIFSTEIPARIAWIAEVERADGQVCASGFLVAQSGTASAGAGQDWEGADWELENIAVLPQFRRQRVGRELLSALLAHAAQRRAKRILLEVRESNEAAICLYRASGFQLLGRRRVYYRNPAEDALILVHALSSL
jgi:ribosomal-protein-alanine N-acetyltransferase